jgi:predicted NBD/HSP70 family sugar kinase
VLTKLIKHLPGGEKLTRWSEAAPYLLAAVVATHHAFFGPVDLMVIGGWSLATWLTERLSNEVASRTRETNRAINRRFETVVASTDQPGG